MMDMHARNEYLKALKEVYMRANKKEKGRILDEYCRNTGQNRKYVIWKIWNEGGTSQRKKRGSIYNAQVINALMKVWEIFDYPCGQRLVPVMREEIERLRDFGELTISDEVARKLKKISARTIDRKLEREKEILRLQRKYHKKKHPLLYHKIPVRGNDWDQTLLGQEEIDLVEHCGSSTAGQYIHSISVTDIASGWWEAQGIMGKGQIRTTEALHKTRQRTPFKWREIHPDNDTAFINEHLFKYAEDEKIKFSRSRPYKKNDNCFVEQKNSTHIRQVVGYLRHDTEKELSIINDLYENELRLYKNFFQPMMKLKEKTREKGKIHRKYTVAETPFQRVLKSKQLSQRDKEELKEIYRKLNPAELKRTIDAKLQRLYEAYRRKSRGEGIISRKKQTVYQSPHPKLSVRFYMTEPVPVGLGV